MTMMDNECEICGQPPIGVASTIMPYSCAYCAECARRGAQPMLVFECFFDDFGIEFSTMHEGLAEELESFEDGKYISYAAWATKQHNNGRRPEAQ